jgi:hypothetical protein
MVDLIQFASLFEIGFALHIAVALLERIYAGELPVRVERISARLNALERFKRELAEESSRRKEGGKPVELRFPYRSVKDPVWADHNDELLDQLYRLGHVATGKLGALKRVLSIITALSIVVVLYTITMLFLVGLDLSLLKGLDPVVASALVLAQLLPLPLAACLFFFVARRMSQEIDRKLRGIAERRVLLASKNSPATVAYASIEEVYQRDLSRQGKLYIQT